MLCMKREEKQQNTSREHDIPSCFRDYFSQLMLYWNGLGQETPERSGIKNIELGIKCEDRT